MVVHGVGFGREINGLITANAMVSTIPSLLSPYFSKFFEFFPSLQVDITLFLNVTINEFYGVKLNKG